MVRWIVIVTGDKLLEDQRTAPEHVLSMGAATLDVRHYPPYIIRISNLGVGLRQLLQSEYTFRKKFVTTHITLECDETAAVFHDIIVDSELSDQDWTTIPAASALSVG
ncbi:hypothetical protein BD779DRAFT_83593 [Infundibulicybe gibba]|nr:hypothetical protein BD779DRAFT_83593 [Infundibulicybe gibba]